MNENNSIGPGEGEEASLDDFMQEIAAGLSKQLHQGDLERAEQVTGIETRTRIEKVRVGAQAGPSPRKRKSTKSSLNESTRQYLNEIARYDLLSADQEVELAMAMEAGVLAREVLDSAEDLDPMNRDELIAIADIGQASKERMIRSNLRLVVSLAKRVRSTTSFDLLDAIQDGNVGLIRATEMFDFRQGFKFSTYATWWIRQSMSRSLADHGRVIRLPVHVVDDINKIGKAHKQLLDSGREISIEAIAEHAELTIAKIIKLLLANREVLSLNAKLTEISEDVLEEIALESNDWPRRFSLADVLVDERDVTESERFMKSRLRDVFESLLDSLSEREAGVIRMRWGLGDGVPKTLEQIGDTFGVTRERIRQIESKTFAKLKHPVRLRSLRDFLD